MQCARVIVTQQANELWSVYTNTGQESMADETLIAWDLNPEQILDHVTGDEAAEMGLYDLIGAS